MDKKALMKSISASALLAAGATAMPAHAAELPDYASGVAMDSMGNLLIDGVSSDAALEVTYGLTPHDAALAAFGLNVGECDNTTTNNCDCMPTPTPTPTPAPTSS